MVCDKVVCERWCATKLWVKDGVVKDDKVVCERWCGERCCVTKLCGERWYGERWCVTKLCVKDGVLKDGV